jgi:flagellum-specific peptidoglycan hydrolase FlgJ
MDIQKTNFLDSTSAAAESAGHIYPTMAACEAALESGYGTSGLAIADHNLFGMKQHSHPVYGTHVLPTREFENGEWEVVNANWVSYPSARECFQDRMTTLLRLSSVFEHYRNAVAAKDAITYVTEVSKTWSTDPERAKKVIDIYNAYVGGN